jgi:putative ABC transport system permease protein
MLTLTGRLIRGLRALFRRSHEEDELDMELQAYLEIAVEDRMRAGMSRSAAVRAARAEIGSLEAVKDHTRDAGWETAVDGIWHDVRSALRSLRTARVFTAVAILTLALGIGANAAIFSLLNGIVLKPLPVHEPHRLATLSTGSSINGGWVHGWEPEIWEQVRLRADAFEGALAVSAFTERFDLAQGGLMQPVDGIFASGEFFTTLGISAPIGRTFTRADDVPGGGPDGLVAVISHAFWRRYFGGSTDVVGAPLVIERVPFTIVGVTPPEFLGVDVGRRFDVALPLATARLVRANAEEMDGAFPLLLAIMLRLKAEQTPEEAIATLRALQPHIFDAAFPDEPARPWTTEYRNDPFALVSTATPGSHELRREYERPLVALLAIVAAVLLLSCANLANLLLARATARRHEWSIRSALGAARWRLARQQVFESLLLAGLGAAAGLGLATAASRALVTQISTFGSPVTLDLTLDWRVLAFTASVTVATVVVFGAAPAWRVTRVEPIDALKRLPDADAGPAGTPFPRRMRTSAGLIVTQVALSLVLLIVAGLFVRTFERLANVPLGFESDRVLVVTVNAARATPDPATRLPLYQRLVDAVSAVPGVAQAAASPMTPFSQGPISIAPIEVVGGLASAQGDMPVVHLMTPDWLATYSRAVHTGRDIVAADTANAPAVAVVNDAFVRRFLPDGRAVGRSLVWGWKTPPQPAPMTVVGIAGDALDFGQRFGAQPTIYVPIAQWTFGALPPEIRLSVRASSGPPALLSSAIAAALTDVDPIVAFTFRPLSEMVDSGVARERLVALLAAAFSTLALLIAAIGLYGVTGYAAARRRTEIGVRMALGAAPAQLVRLVVARTMAWTAAGMVLGVGGAIAVTRYVEELLFEIAPLDPATFIGVSTLLAAAATLAAYLPARRATRRDPLAALRCE